MCKNVTTNKSTFNNKVVLMLCASMNNEQELFVFNKYNVSFVSLRILQVGRLHNYSVITVTKNMSHIRTEANLALLSIFVLS